MVLDVAVPRVILTRLLVRFWKGAYFAPTSPLRLVDLPEPLLPAPDWVRVKNRLCGICGSDLHQLFVDTSLDIAPVGVIAETGEAVADLRVGDRVVRWGRGDDCLARGRGELCSA